MFKFQGKCNFFDQVQKLNFAVNFGCLKVMAIFQLWYRFWSLALQSLLSFDFRIVLTKLVKKDHSTVVHVEIGRVIHGLTGGAIPHAQLCSGRTGPSECLTLKEGGGAIKNRRSSLTETIFCQNLGVQTVKIRKCQMQFFLASIPPKVVSKMGQKWPCVLSNNI